MAMKRLVVCCDGTWQDADKGEGYTNVSRLAWAIKPSDDRGGKDVLQVVFYQSGVGSEGDLFDKVAGGGVGLGLSRNVRDAYAFICNNYIEGDEIFLFGFSRGAYTARSVGGLIGYAGLLGKGDLDRFNELWSGYRLRDKVGQDDPRPQFQNRRKARIKCIGVWDTVGALGIPGNFDKIFTEFYKFHDTGLGVHVDNALHALALDEKRKSFLPTLWQQDPAAKANGQTLKQVWFAGVHTNVGGGYEEHGLSDITLAWMASEVDPLLAIDFDYIKPRRDMRNNWSLGKLYDSAEDKKWKVLGIVTRTPFAAANGVGTNESVHPSVAERIKGAGGAVPGPYASEALKGIDVARNLGVLSAQETALRWSEQDVRPPPPRQPITEPSLAAKIVGFFGGG
jgi:uncharacterized protein (DUF2235 family)